MPQKRSANSPSSSSGVMHGASVVGQAAARQLSPQEQKLLWKLQEREREIESDILQTMPGAPQSKSKAMVRSAAASLLSSAVPPEFLCGNPTCDYLVYDGKMLNGFCCGACASRMKQTSPTG